jgi:polysaccharide deacetylase family protein (PEP-CTERM system associated)
VNGPVNALSVDVEDYFQVSAFAGTIDYSQWDGFALRVGDNTRRILDLFDRVGVKSTFFTLGWVAERCPEVVREIHGRGHEVASHGYRHNLVYNMTPAEFREDVGRTKKILEDACGAEVLGFRAASFSIVPDSFWAMDILGEVGYRYDSSMFPVTGHDRYGTPGIDPAPHRWPHGGLVEIPLSVLPVLGKALPIGGGGYLRQFPYGLTRWAIRRLNAVHGRPVVTYMHPWEIDTGQPPVRPVSWRTRIRHYRGIPGFFRKVEQLVTEFRFEPLAAVAGRVP